MISPAHSIIQSNLFPPLLSGSSRHRASGNREQRRGKRNREKEGWRDRKRREWEHISGPFPVTFLLSAERATMNINMNPGRGNIAFFPFHWAIHAQKESIQVNLMANLCACAWLCEQCCPCSTSPLPPSPSLCLIAVKNTLRQVQLWQTLQYGNQIGLNACKELDTNNYQPTLCISLSVFTQGPLFLILFLWCSEISSQRDANLPTSFLPFPHLQTQIAPGQSQVFLYAEPVTGVTHHSPHVPSLTSS